MKKIILIIPLILIMILGTIIKPKAADIPGYPPDLTIWYSDQLYANYYHMRTGNIEIDNERSVISLFIPNFDNIITEAGQGTEQQIRFYDSSYTEIKIDSVFGRLTGWFNYTIPENAYSFEYVVLVEGPLPSNYVAEWNDIAYIGYGDLLEVYQKAYGEGYDKGYQKGHNEGWGEGYDDGKWDGRIEGYDDGKDDGYDEAYDVIWPLAEEHFGPIYFQKGYDEAANGFGFNNVLGFVLLPFDLLSKEIAYGVTFGHIALIPILFGLIGFLFSIKKGKK